MIKVKIFGDSLFIQAISIAPPLLLRGAPDTARILCRSEATAGEGLAKGPYVAARVGFEHATLQTKDAEFTNEPPRSIIISP